MIGRNSRTRRENGKVRKKKKTSSSAKSFFFVSLSRARVHAFLRNFSPRKRVRGRCVCSPWCRRSRGGREKKRKEERGEVRSVLGKKKKKTYLAKVTREKNFVFSFFSFFLFALQRQKNLLISSAASFSLPTQRRQRAPRPRRRTRPRRRRRPTPRKGSCPPATTSSSARRASSLRTCTS